jgi:N-acyl-D-amino-acid deacylase
MRSAACLCLALGLAAATQPPSPFDIVIRNGRVMDGAANPWVRADIGVRDGRIEAVGNLERATARRVIDARDEIVAPGFIDVHSHAAESIVRDSLRAAAPLVAQGVTTIVVNPDGGGPIDMAAQRAGFEAGGVGVNIAQLIGHGSIRSAVVGSEPRAPTPDELGRMESLVGRAMAEGAFGLSSGLFYTPGSFATTEEVIALARIAARYGGIYTSHVRDESDYTVGVLAAVDEVIRIAEEARVRGIVTHLKALGPAIWGKGAALVERITLARARGVEVFADQYPYDASATTLRAALLPGVQLPTPNEMRGGSAGVPPGHFDRAALASTMVENLRRRGGADRLVVSFFKADPSLEGQSLARIAASRGVTPVDAAFDILALGGASIVSFNMSEDDIETIMRQPFTMTSSDGGLVERGVGAPHPRNNGSHARKLARYVRDRGTVSLEFAIRSATSLPALVFWLPDRGTIRAGAWADLVVFDPATIQDEATYEHPHRLATGVRYVLVNGTLAMDGGQLTGARAGRVLRREARQIGNW